eukprot:gene1288-4896_t
MAKWEKAWARIKKELVPMQKIVVKSRRRKRAKWYNDDIKDSVARRVQASKEVRNANEEEREKREHHEREVKKEVRWKINQAKREHYQQTIAALPPGPVTSSKEGMQLYNSLVGRKKRDQALPDCTADAVNLAFLTKIETIRKPLLSEPKRAPRERAMPKMANFRLVTEEDVRDALERDKGKSSSGIDEVPMSILKKAGGSIAPYVARIANAIIRESRWPQQWKKAEVVPLWKKKGSRKEPKYYRPVSMLPAIARLVERTLAEQIKQHIKMNKILPAFQHGFREKHSTMIALMHLIDKIATAMDEGDTVLVASLDLAGAFDTIDRDILVEKLSTTAGIKDDANQLIKDFLLHREQRVRMGEEKNIEEAVTAAEIVQYADDTTLVVSAETPEEAEEKMNDALKQFQEYATGNRLAAEPTKTQMMLCTTKRNVDRQAIKCRMGGHDIELADSIKVLGVTLDERLSWEAHNAAAAGRAKGIARTIKRATKFMRQSDRATLMQVLVHPYLEYSLRRQCRKGSDDGVRWVCVTCEDDLCTNCCPIIDGAWRKGQITRFTSSSGCATVEGPEAEVKRFLPASVLRKAGYTDEFGQVESLASGFIEFKDGPPKREGQDRVCVQVKVKTKIVYADEKPKMDSGKIEHAVEKDEWRPFRGFKTRSERERDRRDEARPARVFEKKQDEFKASWTPAAPDEGIPECVRRMREEQKTAKEGAEKEHRARDRDG